MACAMGSRFGRPARSQAVLHASIAQWVACRCVPSTAGPPSGASLGSERQLQGDEFDTADVGSGSVTTDQLTTLTGRYAALSNRPEHERQLEGSLQSSRCCDQIPGLGQERSQVNGASRAGELRVQVSCAAQQVHITTAAALRVPQLPH